jgi:predicted cation transporter
MARATRPDPEGDPVLARRAQIAHWVDLGQKVGYGLFGVSVVAFLVGFIVGLEDWVVTLIVACLVVGSIVLAPAIVFGYAVKAAERADRDDDW